VRISDADLEKYRDELLSLESSGIIYATMLDGVTRVDLSSMTSTPPPPPVNFRPNPPLDSVSNDLPAGQRMSSFQDQPPPTEFSMPVPPPTAAIEEPVDPGLAISGLPVTELEQRMPSLDQSKWGKRKAGK